MTENNPLFSKTGAHVLVDGQFGSTGKGAFASWLATQAYEQRALSNFNGAISSSGPNSGHTSVWGHGRIVLKQLPTFGVWAKMLGTPIPCYLSAGAVIDPVVLAREAEEHKVAVFVHPNAAIITDVERQAEQSGSVRDIASTQSGTGAALARKIMREPNAIARKVLFEWKMPPNVQIQSHRLKPESGAYFMEVAQGFSLGINSEFYPHVTSRECTVMQAIADARIPPFHVSRTYMCCRTFPIRVGNLGEHSSGGWYLDQRETTWQKIGVEPELTTVTKRERRVATFSMTQFVEACFANWPNFIGLNFLNYLKQPDYLIDDLLEIRHQIGIAYSLVGGFGPTPHHWRLFDE